MLTTQSNPILEAFRDHVNDYNARGGQDSDPDMKLHPVDQWCHWLTWGDQEVSQEVEHIRHAERVIFRLRTQRNIAEVERYMRHRGKNRVLNDAARYRAERLKMRNPKGWARVLKAVEQGQSLYIRAFDSAEYAEAVRILRRLARLEQNG